MLQNINYYFDSTDTNHPFSFSLESNSNSVCPDNALRTKPEFKDGYCPCEKNGEWVLVKDYRNTDVYSKKTGEKIVINEVGELSGELTIIPPDCEYPIFDEKLQKFVIDQSRAVINKPEIFSRFQALTVLRLTKLNDKTTLYKATDDYINSLSDDSVENITAKTAWETAPEFRRDSALIQLIQRKFELTDNLVDELFVNGADITA